MAAKGQGNASNKGSNAKTLNIQRTPIDYQKLVFSEKQVCLTNCLLYWKQYNESLVLTYTLRFTPT